MEMSLCVENTDVVDVTLERRAVMASVEPIAAFRSGGVGEAKGKKWSALWGALVVALLLAGSASAPQRGLLNQTEAAKVTPYGSGAWCGSARARVEASSGRRASHPDPCLSGLQRVPQPSEGGPRQWGLVWVGAGPGGGVVGTARLASGSLLVRPTAGATAVRGEG